MNGSACGRLIFLIEDDRDVREALLEVLRDSDYRPLAVANGREALDRLRALRTKPCVILLDVMLPIMDGWEFRAAQRNDPDLRSIPVVVLTAHAQAKETAEEMQANGFLKKPVTLQTLLDTVEKFCAEA